MTISPSRRFLPSFVYALALSLSSGTTVLHAEVTSTQSAGLNATLLDHQILSGIRIDDIKFSEASGASYDHDDHLLRIVSDRTRLFSFSLSVADGKFDAIEPVSAVKLRDADGTQMRRIDFNTEGLAMHNADNGITGDASIIVVSESGPSIAQFTLDGQLISYISVPSALRDPELQRSAKDGLESFAQHPVFGMLTAPEEPLRTEPRQTHTIYGAAGKLFSFDVSEVGSTSIKGLEVLPDGRIVILENLKSKDKAVLTPILRLLDPVGCDADLCPTRWAAVPIPGVPDAKFEGVADIGNGMLVIVSDDKIDGMHRTVFGLVELWDD
ncbi:esterase-like activity of phytase family protein [Rhodobacteraceae bacterium B1Z28]|uniref:Esterase-like activity of phytase family protein n=1 Tax=Ruegeria haliotis TaxID=2747601 RepID=A0ABX2PJB1_9RHOB|nr:esterase-like activity of phytase family protein [Ruegeria haliotis]NVO54174.1 esterase-like activity of phytase family protein [Ruegeria haliotis]